MTQRIFPRPLLPGGTIGLVSPSGPSSPESIEQAVAELTKRGYKVVVGNSAGANGGTTHPYLAGTDDQRVADINRFLNDPTIDLILCARGGYGSGRLLHLIDYAAVQRDPKPLVGYSDITALSLALAAQANLVTFSGIMATAGDGFGETSLHPFSEASFWHAVGPDWPKVFATPPGTSWTTHRAGTNDTVTGPVIAVCISLLCSLVGTLYVPDLTGAILVIEDVKEERYAVDRFLNQLRLAGILDGLAALLIGSFNGVNEVENAELREAVPRLCLEMTPPHVPVVSGVAYGHIACRHTLPVGAVAEVNLSTGVFTYLKPG